MAGHGAKLTVNREDQVEGLEIDEDALAYLADLTTSAEAVVNQLRNVTKTWLMIQYQARESVPWADAQAYVNQHTTDVH